MKNKKRVSTTCPTCRKQIQTEVGQRILELEKECINCIEKRKRSSPGNSKKCSSCGKTTYPLNTFLDEKRQKWLCNECKIHETREIMGMTQQECRQG